MARILVSISNSIYSDGEYTLGCFYEQFVSSLVECGNDVRVLIPNMFNRFVFCSDNELKPEIDELSLQKGIKDFNPELVITFNYATYHRLLECVDCPIIIWAADSFYFWNQKDLIKQKTDRFIFFCFFQAGLKDIHDNLNTKHSHVVENATCLRSENLNKQTNISFIGTYFKHSDAFGDYIKKYCGENFLKSIMKGIKEGPFTKFENLVEANNWSVSREEFIDFSKIPESEYQYFFSSELRVNALNCICDLGLDLYGDKRWITLADVLPSLAACYKKQIVYSAKHNQDIYNSSKICLSVMHTQTLNGAPWRTFDIMATNGCLVSEYSPYIENMKCGIPMFDNPFDARELCKKLLKDDIWRQEIIEACNEYVNKHARWIYRIQQMEEILEIRLCNPSEKGNLKILTPIVDEKRKNIVTCKTAEWSLGIRKKVKQLGDSVPTKVTESQKRKKIVVKIWPRTYLYLEKNK